MMHKSTKITLDWFSERIFNHANQNMSWIECKIHFEWKSSIIIIPRPMRWSENPRYNHWRIFVGLLRSMPLYLRCLRIWASSIDHESCQTDMSFVIQGKFANSFSSISVIISEDEWEGGKGQRISWSSCNHVLCRHRANTKVHEQSRKGTLQRVQLTTKKLPFYS